MADSYSSCIYDGIRAGCHEDTGRADQFEAPWPCEAQLLQAYADINAMQRRKLPDCPRHWSRQNVTQSISRWTLSTKYRSQFVARWLCKKQV